MKKILIRDMYKGILRKYGDIFGIEEPFSREIVIPAPFVLFTQILQMGRGAYKSIKTIEENLGFSEEQIMECKKRGILEINKNFNVRKGSLNETMRLVILYFLQHHLQLYTECTRASARKK
jgi:hypothetical protein